MRLQRDSTKDEFLKKMKDRYLKTSSSKMYSDVSSMKYTINVDMSPNNADGARDNSLHDPSKV